MRLLLGRGIACALVAVCAVGASVAVGAVGAPPRAVNGNWSGTTSQNEPITLTVSGHRVISITGTVRLHNVRTSRSAGCPRSTLFSAGLSSGAGGSQKSTPTGFVLTISSSAAAAGRVVSEHTITGTVAFHPAGSTHPCEATATFTAHPG